MAHGRTLLYINGRFLSQSITGVQRYGRELLRELDLLLGSYEDRIEVTVLIPRNVTDIPEFQHLSVRTVGFLSGHAWEQFELPFYSFRGFLFTPGGGAPLVHPRNIVTIHDAAVHAVPAGFSTAFRIWYVFLYKRLCRTSMRILTVSNFSKCELVKWYGAHPERITVTYLGSDHSRRVQPNDSILAKHGLRKDGYLLTVSTKHPNKNFEGVIRALDLLDIPGLEIAIAGKALNHVYQSISLERHAVKDLGYVTDQELRSLYENAACFVFPSKYEGFGLPAVEALSLGCPVVIAGVACMPEVFGEIALYCDPYDPRDIASKIHETLRTKWDQSARTKNSIYASRYSWSKCAHETWAALLEVMKVGG